MQRVGVRELRQNLSVYLQRVRAGQTLEVTDRGTPVAILAPLSANVEGLQRQIRAGRVRPSAVPDGIFIAPKGKITKVGTRALAAERDER
jgi:prevent-host-death family protein